MAIELDHSFAVPVPPAQAWDVLLDVARVAPCMPGATVEEVDGDVVTGKIRVKVGPIALTYSGKATFTERDETTHSVLVEAAGKETRGAGTAAATVRATLDDEDGQTRVRVHTSLNVTGRPAQFGRGVMAEVSGRLIEKFSANLAGQLAADPRAGTGSGGVVGAAAGAGATGSPAAAGSAEAAGGAGAEAVGAGAAGGGAGADAAGAGGAGVAASGQSEQAAPASDARLTIPIQELNLPARSVNCLKSEGIDTVGELVSRSPADLLAVKNIGERSITEIQDKLRDLGLALAEAPPGQVEFSSPETGPAEFSGPQASPAGAPDDRSAWDGGVPAADLATPAPVSTPMQEAPARSAGFGSGQEHAGEPMDDAIDLLDLAAGPILKRALPAVGAAILLTGLGILVRRRLRSH